MNLKIIYFFVPCFYFLLLNFSCSETANTEKQILPSQAYVLKDLQYGPDMLNTLDLYLPAGRNETTPAIIFIHGGGWVHGDKSEFYTKYAEELFGNKWIVANMNYRLVSKQVNYKSIMTDVKRAIGFLSLNANKYAIFAKQFVLVGHSAGGHISLLYAHYYDSLQQVKLVVSYAGPTNINSLKLKLYADSVWDMPFLYPLLLGEKFSLNSKVVIDGSPVYHVKTIPTLLIHGTDDPIVPYAQALQMNDSLEAKKVKHLLISIPKGNHNLHNMFSDSINRMIKRWAK
jgi:acetyl esterase/lipase